MSSVGVGASVEVSGGDVGGVDGTGVSCGGEQAAISANETRPKLTRRICHPQTCCDRGDHTDALVYVMSKFDVE